MSGVRNTLEHPACPGCGGLKEWSTTEELCAWLGIDKPTLYYMAGHGKAPRRHRIGKTFRYRRGDVEAWLASRAD
jgi:excisionase family DNA binding protein